MIVRKTYKVRVYPNQAQETELKRTLAGCHFVWNFFLKRKQEHYVETKKSLTYNKMSAELTQLRKTAPELEGVQYVPLQQELRRLDSAFNRFFRQQARFPKFKNEYRNKRSFQKPGKDWVLKDGKIQIQRGVSLKVRGTLPPANAEIGTVIISLVADKWYASIFVTEDISVPHENTAPIGIDVGINALATTSNGKKYGVRPNTSWDKIAQLQRKLLRQEAGSKRYTKTRKLISAAYGKASNQRLDHLHKTTDTILKENPSLVATETLGIANMLKNHRLAKSIAHVSWGEFLRQVRYKTEWRGGEMRAIDRFYPSSKTCNECLYVLDKLPLSVREWECPGCGLLHDRDVNAAKVILKVCP